MPAPHNPVNPVDLYDSAYGNYAADVYRQVRLATYGEDLGQTSWVTSEESRAIPQMLQLTPASRVLEIGSGSGGYALQVASVVGCSIVGVDINDAGAGEYRASVISAITLLEAKLRDRLNKDQWSEARRPFPLRSLIDQAVARNLIPQQFMPPIRGWMQTRNEAVHTSKLITKARAREIVDGVFEVIARMEAY
jgi:hypothetical protein